MNVRERVRSRTPRIATGKSSALLGAVTAGIPAAAATGCCVTCPRSRRLEPAALVR